MDARALRQRRPSPRPGIMDAGAFPQAIANNLTPAQPAHRGSINFAALRHCGRCCADRIMRLHELFSPVADPRTPEPPHRLGKTLTRHILSSLPELSYEHPGQPGADAGLFDDACGKRCARVEGCTMPSASWQMGHVSAPVREDVTVPPRLTCSSDQDGLRRRLLTLSLLLLAAPLWLATAHPAHSAATPQCSACRHSRCHRPALPAGHSGSSDLTHSPGLQSDQGLPGRP